jgi:Ca2+-binding RTX toxin-like protein
MARIDGTDGHDELFGGVDNDRVYGRGGGDWLTGGQGDDRVEGGKGEDVIRGDEGNDVLNGGWGDDSIYGESGFDRISGGDGRDRLGDQFGGALIRAGRGDDFLAGSGATVSLFGDAGDDELLAFMRPGEGGSYGWVQQTGGRGADAFVALAFEDGVESWCDVHDFNARQSDRFDVQAYLDPGDTAPTSVAASLDSNRDGRLDDSDDAVWDDGNALWLTKADGATGDHVLFHGVASLDLSMLAGF